MNLKNLTLATALVLAIPSFGLVSCSKKKSGYTVRVVATDEKSARVWRDSSSLKDWSKQAIYYDAEDSLASFTDSNANDAKITSVLVSYLDEKGKRVIDDAAKGGVQVGEKVEKEYQISANRTLVVTATAEQTSTTISSQKAVKHTGLNKGKEWNEQVKGNLVDPAAVKLKVDILKDGIVVSSQTVEFLKKAEATATAISILEK